VVVFVIGAAGAGKTTVGQAVARQIGWRFIEGDDYHSPSAIAKMRGGTPLNDSDRAPWLAKLHAVAASAIDRREHAVIAGSALKQRYREFLRGTLRGVRFVYLKADEPTLRRRLEQRSHDFAGPALLAGQLADLEEPGDALTIDATKPAEFIVATIRYEFGL
jgi:carbohydrate kinase (thermoresistant glucokinase family)